MRPTELPERQSLPNVDGIFQQSSLLTPSPPAERHPKDIKTTVQERSQSKEADKILLFEESKLGQLSSMGEIRFNITVPASALTFGKLLGEGAYGSVYEGLWNDQPVAIKRLRAQHLTEQAVHELRQEAQIMFQLGVESKYIVPLKKICLESPYYSLVMELMPKGSLYHLLHSQQSLPWTIRFQIALDVAWGLKDLHSYHILHRDLKSLNILLDDRLRAKLADFGLAKVKQETSSQSTAAKGTVLWMAPELFKRKTEVTEAADIWSLGMVLWELATREIPFKDAQNQLQVIGWLKDGEKEEIPVDCPAELKSIIESCWDLTPTKRPTAIQVMESLKPLVPSITTKEPAKIPVHEHGDQRPPTLREIKVSNDEKSFVSSQKAFSVTTVELQDELIKACEDGNEVEVQKILNKGANPYQLNSQGKHPLCAAMFGMNFLIVNDFIDHMNGISPLTFEECEQHNMKYYHQKWSLPETVPTTKADLADMLPHMKNDVMVMKLALFEDRIILAISELYIYRNLIKSKISQSTTKSKNPISSSEMVLQKIAMQALQSNESLRAAEIKQELPLQDKLVKACKTGDEKGVQVALDEGADPSAPDSKGAYPLPTAMYGMNPFIFYNLLNRLKGVSPPNIRGL